MSQAGGTSSSSGPLPPVVATSYVTDNGTAVPSLNVLDIFGGETIADTDNGIATFGGFPETANSFEIDIRLTNRSTDVTKTEDATPVSFIVYTPVDTSSTTFRLFLTGYDTNGNAIGGEQIGLALKTGGVATIIGTNDTFDESSPALNTADWKVDSSGGTLIITLTGVAATTIFWRTLFEYITQGLGS